MDLVIQEQQVSSLFQGRTPNLPVVLVGNLWFLAHLAAAQTSTLPRDLPWLDSNLIHQYLHFRCQYQVRPST
jgi:hypothetical protein